MAICSFDATRTRNTLIAKRQSLPEKDIQTASLKVAEFLNQFNSFQEAQRIGYYIANKGEIDPLPLLQSTQHPKQTYLPALDPDHHFQLLFYFHPLSLPVQYNRFKIAEPITTNQNPIALTELDVVLVPLVGFDAHGNRLGRGAGCYDRTFAFKSDSNKEKPLLIGLAYEFQKLDHIPHQSWDVKMDLIVTEKQIYYP